MSKMADVSLLLFVTCELSYNSGRNNSFHGLKIGFLLFVLFFFLKQLDLDFGA